MKMLKAFGFAFLLIMVLGACTRIEPGHVGIKVDLSGENRTVSDIDVVSGWQFYWPLSTQIVQYPYITRRYEWHGDDQLRFNAQEGVGLGMDVAISLGVNPERAAELYVKYRRTLPEMIDTEIRDRVNGCLIDTAGSMRVDAIVGVGRTSLRENALVCIRERLDAEGFVVNDFQFTNDFDLPQLIRDRINSQIEAQQAAIAAENTVAQVEAEARQREAQALGEANARRLTAQAEADARMLQATAEAQALTIQGEALRTNPEVLQLNFIQQWDGRLPLVTGGAEGMLLDIDSLIGTP